MSAHSAEPPPLRDSLAAVGRTALRTAALVMLCVYLAWNVYFLAIGSPPPALFKAITGLPAPTTGGTRSLLALLHGDWRASLRHNPMTVPIISLLAASAFQLIRRRLQNRPLRLSAALGYGWLIVLALAWLLKLLIHQP